MQATNARARPFAPSRPSVRPCHHRHQRPHLPGLGARLVVEPLQLLKDDFLDNGVRARQAFIDRVDGDVLLLAVLLDGLALEVDGANGALAGLAQKGYRPVQSLRMSEYNSSS